ncbi:uncharacterized protein BP5553_01347 [Venustampulla echinocandica]|uniref:Uncharacterized protein n=1 Tax=Venustampulla echinocandica TaxID=2656787 RepID=A0A370U0S3_9HELO|nr:uncharacterized protein BP5553_01347 [Venustampulla echinocandica]RDL41368.1 hypothetical protein BP5553_01347 [Venustampulla echinocandica]
MYEVPPRPPRITITWKSSSTNLVLRRTFLAFCTTLHLIPDHTMIRNTFSSVSSSSSRTGISGGAKSPEPSDSASQPSCLENPGSQADTEGIDIFMAEGTSPEIFSFYVIFLTLIGIEPSNASEPTEDEPREESALLIAKSLIHHETIDLGPKQILERDKTSHRATLKFAEKITDKDPALSDYWTDKDELARRRPLTAIRDTIGDDKKEYAEEAFNMVSIYANSTHAIIAAPSGSDHSGFLDMEVGVPLLLDTSNGPGPEACLYTLLRKITGFFDYPPTPSDLIGGR